MKRISGFSLLMCISVIASGCNVGTKTVADRCVLVNLQAKRGRELIPLLDVFAQKNDLSPEKSHPVNPRYELIENGEMVAEVSYVIGMGRHGAELAVFQYEGTDAQFLRAFDEFVKYEVSEKYKVTQCADVPGFQTPEVYR